MRASRILSPGLAEVGGVRRPLEVETSGWPCMGSGEDRKLVLAFSLAQSSMQVLRGVNSVTSKQLDFESLEYIRSYSYNGPNQTPMAIETVYLLISV
jgi:hypothetical protein